MSTILRFDPKPKSPGFECPPGMHPHVARVFAGEYDVDVDFDAPPSILDIGANVGAFAVWAATRWDTEDIQCYEPHPDTFRTLCRNIQKRSQRVRLHNVAVVGGNWVAPDGKLLLYPGLNNCGEASLYDLGEQNIAEPVTVDIAPAATLPRADIVKLDTEGAELDILRSYDLADTSAVLLEYHRQDDLVPLLELLHGADFDLVGGTVYGATRGVLKFVTR